MPSSKKTYNIGPGGASNKVSSNSRNYQQVLSKSVVKDSATRNNSSKLYGRRNVYSSIGTYQSGGNNTVGNSSVSNSISVPKGQRLKQTKDRKMLNNFLDSLEKSYMHQQHPVAGVQSNKNKRKTPNQQQWGADFGNVSVDNSVIHHFYPSSHLSIKKSSIQHEARQTLGFESHNSSITGNPHHSSAMGHMN